MTTVKVVPLLTRITPPLLTKTWSTETPASTVTLWPDWTVITPWL